MASKTTSGPQPPVVAPVAPAVAPAVAAAVPAAPAAPVVAPAAPAAAPNPSATATHTPASDHPAEHHTEKKHWFEHLPTNHYKHAVAAASPQPAASHAASAATPTKDDQKRESHEALLAKQPSAGFHSTSH